jgi:hypothetical protein
VNKVEELFSGILTATASYLPTLFKFVFHPRKVIEQNPEQDICPPSIAFFVSASLAYGAFVLNVKDPSALGIPPKHEQFVVFAICYVALIANFQRWIFDRFSKESADLQSRRRSVGLLTYPYSVAAFLSSVAYFILPPRELDGMAPAVLGMVTSVVYVIGLFQVGRLVFLLSAGRALMAAMASSIAFVSVFGLVAYVLAARV